MRILYDSKELQFKDPFGTVKENEPVRIRIKIPDSCGTTRVKLNIISENGAEYASYSMRFEGSADEYSSFVCRFSLCERGLYFYHFHIYTKDGDFPLFKEGYDMTNMHTGESWQISCLPSSFSVPEEFCGAVMYQIFPDRFNKYGKSDCSGKLEPFWVHDSTKDIPEFLPNSEGKVLNCDFYGGNLKGIEKKLDYIKSLGVSVIYLNPIFKAYSNHRYDTADYMKIDEMLGNEEDFKSLCDKAHKMGIKIILDGVFSHTGSNSVYFDSEGVFGGGAISDENSPFKEWFDFQEYPHKYTSWWGIDTLPCVNETNDSFLDYIIRNEDSVVAHWIKLGADGFRLDVADELPDSFIYELRKRLKELNPKALLLGEVWEDASNKISYGYRRKYFTDGELDSVMNYPFRNAIIDFVKGIDNGYGFKSTVMGIAENYPKQVLNTVMNMLSTHDTSRILTVLGDDFYGSKSEKAGRRMIGEQLEIAKQRFICASALQFMLPGMPCIFYGDEIGTEGYEDPFCRSYFDWDRVEDNKLLEALKEISSLKNKNEVLKKGGVRVEVISDGCIKILREYNEERLSIVVNTGEDVSIKTTDNCILQKGVLSENGEFKISRYGFAVFSE